MRHRHLHVEATTPVTELGAAALDDLLDRGDLDDWGAVLHELRRDPWGGVAERVLGLVHNNPMYGTSRLWRSWIEEQRAARPRWRAGQALRELRVARGRTQQEVARRMGMTQPEVSKLERRADVRVSTLQSYVAALAGSLELVARFGDDEVRLDDGVAVSGRPERRIDR